FNWNAPVLVSSHDTQVLYHGAQLVLKSTNRGQSWTAISPDLTRNDKAKQGTIGGPIMLEGAGGEHYGTLMYIAESPHDAGTIWTGSDDGRVFLTRDGGGNWQDVTPRRMPEAQVNTIEISPHDPATAYIAVTRYKFNDFTPMIYKTDDYGQSWTSGVRGIDDEAFVRVVREDPERKGLLYAGTESGAYVSFDDGRRWQPLQLNLPKVPITDLRVHDNDLVAATQGRSFWILDDVTPLHQIDDDIGSQRVYLFEPRAAYRLDGRSWRSQQAKNPPDGAVIYYAVNQEIDEDSGELSLEILNADGDVIRRFSNSKPEEEAGGFVKGVIAEPPPPPLQTKLGLNRYVWNLRAERFEPVSDTIRYVSMRPYRVAPGTYQARLTFKGQSVTESFEVVPDPRREPLSAAAWAEQQQLLGEMAGLVNDIHASTMRMRAIAAQTQRVMEATESSPQGATIVARGQALIGKIAAWEVHVPQPPLPDDVEDRIAFPSRLLSTQVLHMMRGIDQDPPVNAGSKLRAQELKDQWAEIEADMRDILHTDLRELNSLLSDGQVPHIEAP
ncbi:MAG: WD40/YVTN/BNR-like repeat-containing protein, partial [Woeseiaceae bacterium]